MTLYLAPEGAALLIKAQAGQVPPLMLTGAQIGDATAFVPTSGANNARGNLVYNQKANPASVLQTLVSIHKKIFTVRIDQTQEFDYGNVLIFANNQPFLWLVLPYLAHTRKIDGVAHFAGDELFLPMILNYPYLRNLTIYTPAYGLHAKFPVIPDLVGIPKAEETPALQMVIERNTLWYGRGQAALACKFENKGWYAHPLGFDFGERFEINGGKTISGA